MAAVTVGIALQEGMSVIRTFTFYCHFGDFMNGSHVLPINACGFDAESGRATEDSTSCGFLVMRVLVVLIVLTNVDHRQLPQLRQVHYLVQRTLAECAFSKEADGDAIRTQSLGGESRARGDADA